MSFENNKYHLLKDHKPYKAEIIFADFIVKNILLKSITMVIADTLDMLITSMGIGRGRTKVINAIKVPMPRLILEISFEVV